MVRPWYVCRRWYAWPTWNVLPQERVTRDFALAVTGTFAACLLLGASFLAWIKHDFDRLERALLNAADKSERDRELDSVERRRGGPGVKGSGGRGRGGGGGDRVATVRYRAIEIDAQEAVSRFLNVHGKSGGQSVNF